MRLLLKDLEKRMELELDLENVSVKFCHKKYIEDIIHYFFNYRNFLIILNGSWVTTTLGWNRKSKKTTENNIHSLFFGRIKYF